MTLKMRREVWNLRARRAMACILPALAAVMARVGMRVVHYSVQHDHIHLIVETENATSLSRAVQGLCVRIARRLNALMGRKGKVFADRFHERVLASPRQVRSALRYVLLNARKHGVASPERRWLDPCSSASVFDGWSIEVTIGPGVQFALPTAVPTTWLLRVGWRRGGPLIDPGERPGALTD